MKKAGTVLLCALLVLILCACSSASGADKAYTVYRNGTEFVVDPQQETVFDGTHTYHYRLSGDTGSYGINITYPDGSTYWWQTQKSGGFSTGSGGWSDNYDASRYVSGDTLCDVLATAVPKEQEPKNVLLILLLLAVGIFNTASPHTAWYLEYGWRYKDAEPSDMALTFSRLGGILAIIAAVILIFV